MANDSRSLHFQEAFAITSATTAQYAASPSTYHTTVLDTLDTRITTNTDIASHAYRPFIGTEPRGSTVYIWATTRTARLLPTSTTVLAAHNEDTDEGGRPYTLTYTGDISSTPA